MAIFDQGAGGLDVNQHLAGLSYRRPRQLEFNPETGEWEDSNLSPADYDQKYAGNEARGSFKTFGTVQATGPDNSGSLERGAIAQQDPYGPQFYGGTSGNNGPLQGLRDALAKEAAAKQKKERGY
jgi:hypothetical protein